MLTLEIGSYQKASSEQTVSMQLEQGSMRIGRDASNDWSLPDPARVLSKHHCSIERLGNDYFVTDTSTNGVFINTSAEPLGRGNQSKLADGDKIRISDYEIQVKIAVQSGEPQVAQPLVPPASPTPPVDVPVYAPPPPPPSNVPADGGDWKAILEPRSQPPAEQPTQDLAVDVPELTQTHYDAPSVGMSIPEDWGSADSTEAVPQVEPQHTPQVPEQPIPTPVSPTAPVSPVTESQPVQQTPPPAAPVASPVATSSSSNDLISAFLRGAGVDPATRLPVNDTEFMQEIGSLFRQVTMGLMGVLAARGDIKSEFRLSQTMIRPTENNPLKFSLNIEEALVALINKRGQGYMSAEAAFDEAFDDIKSHQLAVLTGMQSAMKNLLARLEPERIKGRDEDKKGMQKLLGGQKSKYWDEFELLYKTLFQQSEDDFQTLFNHEFSKAYEQQIQKQKHS